MEQKDFQNILRKYRRGEATDEERKVIDAWYLSLGRTIPDEGNMDESVLEARLWATIQPHLIKSKKKDNIRKLAIWSATGVAASIVLAVVVGYLIIGTPGITNDEVSVKLKDSFSWTTITNTKPMSERFTLPDSSKVTLGPGSKLKFSSVFNEVSREVILEGEAFFEVTKNAERPFLVYANEVTTKVLGTSFTVKAFEQEANVTIAVRTGRVSVFTNHDHDKVSKNQEIILTPNQQIVFDKEKRRISKMLVDKPVVLLPTEEVNRMRFEEAPVTEIFEALERLYGVEILFDKEILSSCELTTIISDDDIYKRLSIICNAIGASYVLENGVIKINSAGCD